MAISNMDFSYFSSAPLPYQVYGAQQTNAGRDGEFQFDEYAIMQGSEPFSQPFSHFQDAFQFDNGVTPTQRQPHTRSPSRPSLNQTPLSPVQGSYDASTFSRAETMDDVLRPRSSSEEKDSATPQQNKRKAQNRAAQRAFRERKEKHLKDLEAKLADLQQQSMSLDSENERLRKELAKVATENEILKATANGQLPSDMDHDDLFGPSGFKSTHSTSKVGLSKDIEKVKFNLLQTIIIDDSSGEPLLNAGQTWDYIQAHELFRKGLVDVGDVCERLKKMARCHGQGPVFRESDIRQAVADSAVAGGRDELI